TVITTLADDLEELGVVQAAHWARHRRDALDRAVADVHRREVMAMTDDQVREELIRHGLDPDDQGPTEILRRLLADRRPEGTIRDTPDFPEDPEDSPFADPVG